MFLVNSRYPLFVETTFGSGRRPSTYRWHTLSRSYGVNLPSSLTRVLSSALVFSTCPPESVWGTVTSRSTQPAAFLGSVGSITSTPRSHGITSQRCPRVFFLRGPPTGLHRGYQRPADLPFSVPALLPTGGTGMFARLPSASPFGYALGAD